MGMKGITFKEQYLSNIVIGSDTSVQYTESGTATNMRMLTGINTAQFEEKLADSFKVDCRGRM